MNIQLKNGFTYQGFESSISGGSFGQIQGEFQDGRQADSLANFFVGDPDLQQVISYTAEAGLRGSFTPFATAPNSATISGCSMPTSTTTSLSSTA